MRLHCNVCGKSVSNEVPDDTIVRAWLECPECIEAARDDDPSLKPRRVGSWLGALFGKVLGTGVVLLALSGCTTAGGNTRVNWPAVASCAPSTSDVVGSVSRVLLTDGNSSNRSISERAVSELEGLAREHTPRLVACLVDELVRGWSAPGAAAHPDRVAATQRGRDFLDRVAGTSVIRREDP